MCRQKKLQINYLYTAADRFALNDDQRELLANKAGFTLKKENNFTDYLTCLDCLIRSSHKKQKTIYENAQISGRMFRRIKSDYHPTKPSLLALALSLELEPDTLSFLLQKAGYILSKSIAFDMVVNYLIENYPYPSTKLFFSNNVLYELGLPLLMTREKS